ncbi:TonB-dependent receptor [Gluconacetobacter asukensis]|uniref:TonB-dependent receptor plug domain-containing protein n=1 Tax=Gluconacetobacter asukensis TaxID=1017181 RepID=A0A7W4J0E1_9PROT|nr:TonB-dependent receptor plug domain-containing protein [Gluconacetobacter asukensis]MBB2172413.1 TonB-dependent receptor plug domain-containing protein [Gluconacetobacter asukensis]
MRDFRLSLKAAFSLATALGTVCAADAQTVPARSRHMAKPVATAKAVPSQPAHAKARNAAVHSAAETVAVTAQRRAFKFTAQQHEATSTTYLDAQVLAERHINTVMDLGRVVPNLTVQSEGGSTAPSFYLRGIGLQDYTQNNMPSVLTYFDGVPFPIASMSSGMMFDVQSVAAEPGPVGFTHGLGDTGGEVRIESNAPTKQLHYGATEDIATRDRSKTVVYVSGPITDKLQYRIAGENMEGGAFRFNRVTGQKIGNANFGAIRGRLAWQPDEKTNIDLIANWSLDRSEATTSFVLQDFSKLSNAPRDTNIYATGWSLNPVYAKVLGISPNSVPSNNDVNWNITLKGDHDFGFAKLYGITSFAQQQRHEYIDRDALAFRSGDTYFVSETNMFSQELGLQGRPLFHDRFHWVVGMYYNRIRNYGSNWFDLSDYIGLIRDSTHQQPEQNFSQFATLGYDITRKLKLSFSLSHQTDDRQLVGDDIRQYYYGATASQCGGAPSCWTSHAFGTHGALTNQFSGKTGINYQATRNVLAYFTISRGVKPGGFTTNTTVSDVQIKPFKPEWVLAYEVGLKTEFFDHRLRLNWAAFYDDYHDKQILGTVVIPGNPKSYTGPTPGTYGSYVNIPHSEIWGTEFQLEAHPFRGFSLSQNFGYLRSKYTDYQQVNSAAVSAGYAVTGIYTPVYTDYGGADMGLPKLTLSGMASYDTRPFWNHYMMNFEVDYSYRTMQDSLQPRGTGVYVVPPYFLLGASVTFKPVNSRWFVTAYASNLTNRHYIDVVSVAATTVLTGISGEPRFVGGRFGVDF